MQLTYKNEHGTFQVSAMGVGESIDDIANIIVGCFMLAGWNYHTIIHAFVPLLESEGFTVSFGHEGED